MSVQLPERHVGSFAIGLKCKECGHRTPAKPTHVCSECFGPLEVEYDYDAMKRFVTRERIESGPKSLWRYHDLLPVDGPARTGYHSGLTPLVRADRLAKHLGLRELYIKDDSANHPTFSYKERVVSVALSKAIEFGFTTVGCASTGNLATSVAAHAGRMGLDCYVLVPHDVEAGKVIGCLVYGAKLVRIMGNYDDVNRLCGQIADKYGWALVNVNLRPYYTEGAKTFGFEIAEQLGWRLPRHTVLPTAGGTILPKVHKAYNELRQLGLVADQPAAIHCAQAAGCDPVVKAIHAGDDEIIPQKPNTIAKSIAIGNPADGIYAYDSVTSTGGKAASVPDEAIIDAIKLLARTEGIFTEPAGGTTLAAAIQLIEQGDIPRDESIVVGITGNGLKCQEAIDGHLTIPEPIDSSLKAFDTIAEQH